MADIRCVEGENGYWCGDKQVPSLVVEAIAWKFRGEYEEYQRVMEELVYDGLMGVYFFRWAGMYLGVEEDGHIHS